MYRSKVGNEHRKLFPEFFKKHIENIKKNKLTCQECGCKLIGDVSEVAHILPKQRFKSVSTEDNNVIYLCSWKSKGMNCHSIFDDSEVEVVKEMKIYPQIKDRFLKLKELLTEKLTWKDIEKYE